MKHQKHVVCHKKNDQWIADQYVVRHIQSDIIYELSYQLTVYIDGRIEEKYLDTSLIVNTLMKDELYQIRTKLAELIWNDLCEKSHWITKFRNIIDPYNFKNLRGRFVHEKSFNTLGFIIDGLRTNLSNKIKKQLSLLTDQDSVFSYISNYSESSSVLQCLSEQARNNTYTLQMYNPKTDIIICRSFDEPEVIVTLLSYPYKDLLFTTVNIEYAIRFLRWLQRHYLVEEIVQLIINKEPETKSFSDIMRMVQVISALNPKLYSKYVKSKNLTLDHLYDGLIRMSSYGKVQSICTEDLGFEIDSFSDISFEELEEIYPKDKILLMESMDQLSICFLGFNIDKYESVSMFDFNKPQYKSACRIIGVYKNDLLYIAISHDCGSYLTPKEFYDDSNEVINFKFTEIDNTIDKVDGWLRVFSNLFL